MLSNDTRAPNRLRMWLPALFLLLGAVLNSYNLLATLGHPRPLQPSSLIIGLISSANVLLNATTLAMHVVESEHVLQRARLPLYLPVLLVVWLGTSAVSFWSVALLSTLYCVTVVRSSSPLLLTVRRNVGVVVRAGLTLMLVSSYLVFLPFLSLQRQNVTCVSSVVGFPVRLNMYVYVASFISYMLLLPMCTMLPTSLRLVFFLFSHALSMKAHHGGVGSPDSYLLVCGVTVALVWVFICTLITITIFYIHSTYYSKLSADFLFYTFSFYCLASATLLSASNLPLRQRLQVLFCRPCAVQG
uniref:Taste receptor type 2 n=1 Tax=Gadus morhua TaxID=8049 RepID=A0A8C4ZAQ2_GADMO